MSPLSPDHRLPDPVQHPSLVLEGMRHGFFTRAGGVSTGLYAGLNVGLGSDDDPEAVRENRTRVSNWMGGTADDLATPYQIHSAITRVAEGPWRGDRPEGDAVVSAASGAICGVLTADCAPVLLADAQARVVGAVHAGWKGALDGVVASAVHAMLALGARNDRIVAVVGPCIAPESYEVGDEFRERFVHHDAGSERFFAPHAETGRPHFDLPGFVLWRLEQARIERAAWTGHDTCVGEARFYSNRRAFRRGEPDFGRQMSAIVLV